VKPARHQPAVPLVDTEHHEPVREVHGPWFLHWTMRDEFAFLRGLGSWRRRECVVDRAQLLRGYLEGLALRRRWTDLQHEPLECEARLLLKDLAKGRQGQEWAS